MEEINKKKLPLFSPGEVICALFITALAIFFRFYLLEDRGLFIWDEGYYTQIIASYRAGFDYLVKTHILGQDLGSIAQYLHNYGGTFKSVFKDGFTYSGFLTSIIFGVSHNTVLYTNALVGSLSVIMVYACLRRSMNCLLASIFTLGLAFSPYHIAFSRGGFSVVFASFYLIISFYLYISSFEDSRYSRLFISAIFAGLSFSCHYTIGALLLAYLAIEAFYAYTNKSLKRTLIFLSGFISPLLLLEAISQFIKYFINIKVSDLPSLYRAEFVTYFGRAIQQFQEAQAGPAIKGLNFYYIKNLIMYEGVAVLLLLLVALIVLLLFKKRGYGRKLAFLFIISFGVITMINTKVDRVLLPYIPLIYLLIGLGINSLRKMRKAAIVVFIIFTMINAYRSLDLFNYRSNFDKAVTFMESHKGAKHLSDDMYVSRAYVGRRNAVDDYISIADNQGYDYSVDLEKIEELYKNGFKYFLCYSNPYRLNEITVAALSLEPDFAVASWGNNQHENSSYGLLRSNNTLPSRHIYIWDLKRVTDRIQQSRSRKE